MVEGGAAGGAVDDARVVELEGGGAGVNGGSHGTLGDGSLESHAVAGCHVAGGRDLDVLVAGAAARITTAHTASLDGPLEQGIHAHGTGRCTLVGGGGHCLYSSWLQWR